MSETSELDAGEGRFFPCNALLGKLRSPHLETRYGPGLLALCLEAADEIERLATQNCQVLNFGTKMDEENDRVQEVLAQIGDYAHHQSSGPDVPDALWEIRSMAYDAVRLIKPNA